MPRRQGLSDDGPESDVKLSRRELKASASHARSGSEGHGKSSNNSERYLYM